MIELSNDQDREGIPSGTLLGSGGRIDRIDAPDGPGVARLGSDVVDHAAYPSAGEERDRSRPSQCDGSRTFGIVAASEPEMVRHLEATACFKVLRAVPDLPPADVDALPGAPLGVGVVLDVETTGLRVTTAEVLELGMVKFVYDRDGWVVGVLDRFSGLRQPWSPILATVTRLTGIDDAMVAGHEIDGDAVAAFLRGVDLVVAHNARFDRPSVEARWPVFSRLSWACSCTEVGWADEGFDGAKLGHLLMQAGFFHTAHRAVDDAQATLHLLALPLPTSGRSGLASLLDRAQAPISRVWAERAPFEAKDVLRARGYRWSPGARGLPRSWYRDLHADVVDVEVAFLERAILGDGASPRVVPISALDRFTDRAGATRGRSA